MLKSLMHQQIETNRMEFSPASLPPFLFVKGFNMGPKAIQKDSVSPKKFHPGVYFSQSKKEGGSTSAAATGKRFN